MAGNLHFLTVNKHSESHVISFVKDAFSQRSDEKATDSVLDSDDWRCEVFLATASSPAAPVPLGFVVYKLKPTDEYSRLGLTNSVEIKALYLADPSKTRGKGYRSFMLSRVVNYARSIASSGVHTIVPDIKSDLSTFFLDKKFKDLGFLPSSHDEAPDKLYALRLSGNDKEIHNKVHHSGTCESKHAFVINLHVLFRQRLTRFHLEIRPHERTEEKTQVSISALYAARLGIPACVSCTFTLYTCLYICLFRNWQGCVG